MTSYHMWRAAPRSNAKKPHASEGSAVLTSRQAAIEETLTEKAKEQIRAEAKEAAAEALAAFDVRRGRR